MIKTYLTVFELAVILWAVHFPIKRIIKYAKIKNYEAVKVQSLLLFVGVVFLALFIYFR